MPDEEGPRAYRVAVTGSGVVPPRTTIWRPRHGGRYDGHPSVKFRPVTIREMDFSGLHLNDFEADGTTFVRCDFSRTAIDGFLSLTRRTVFEDCTLMPRALAMRGRVKRDSRDACSQTSTCLDGPQSRLSSWNACSKGVCETANSGESSGVPGRSRAICVQLAGPTRLCAITSSVQIWRQ